MKLKSFLRSAGAKVAGLALMVAALTSCGGKELTQIVPADVKIACRFDVKQMALNSGCSFDDNGQLVLSPEINNAINGDFEMMTKVKMALSMTEGFDLSDGIFFLRTNNEPTFVISLTNEAKVIENITSVLGEPATEDGFKTFYPDGAGREPVIAVKDGRAWVASNLEIISDAIEAAGKKHIGTMPGIEQFLNADNAFAVVVGTRAIDVLPANFRDQWVCGSIKFDGKVSTGELCIMDADGKRYPFGDAFGVMSTDFLRYVPADMNIVAALGPIESETIKSMMALMATNLGSEGKYLTDLDGTMAFALDMTDAMPSSFTQYVNGNLDWHNLKGIGMVHYPQQTVNDLVQTISDNLALQGQVVENGPDGQKTFAVDSMEFYMGAVDGYFAIANFPITPNTQNELTTKFNGRRGAIYSFSPAMPSMGLEFASESTVWLESDAIKGESKVIDSDKPYLQSIIAYLLSPQMREAFKQLLAQDNIQFDADDFEFEYDDEPVEVDLDGTDYE